MFHQIHNILVTQEGEANVLVFTHLDTAQLTQALHLKGIQPTDVFEVQDIEIQYYCFEPLWLNHQPQLETRLLGQNRPSIPNPN